MKNARVLFAGEQFSALTLEIKAFDHMVESGYTEMGAPLYAALTGGGHEVTWLKTFEIPTKFPETREELADYDVVVLSDVGSNSLLLHPEVLQKSRPRTNRLDVIRSFIADGGGFLMVGGWMSFSGIEGKARYNMTPLADALPVVVSSYDDRIESPEGPRATVCAPEHPILKGVDSEWPFFLGYNRVEPKQEATTILRLNEDPLLTVGPYGTGRAAAFTSDCAPHWGPEEFLQWKGYQPFWANLVGWLAGN